MALKQSLSSKLRSKSSHSKLMLIGLRHHVLISKFSMFLEEMKHMLMQYFKTKKDRVLMQSVNTILNEDFEFEVIPWRVVIGY
jgi:hypothetical protein